MKAGGNSLVKPGTGKTSGKLVNTITWIGGKGTTVATIKYAPAKTKGKCPAGTSRVTITGTVQSCDRRRRQDHEEGRAAFRFGVRDRDGSEARPDRERTRREVQAVVRPKVSAYTVWAGTGPTMP